MGKFKSLDPKAALICCNRAIALKGEDEQFAGGVRSFPSPQPGSFSESLIFFLGGLGFPPSQVPFLNP